MSKQTNTFYYEITSNPDSVEDLECKLHFDDPAHNPLTMQYCDMMGIALARMLSQDSSVYAKHLEQVMREVAEARLEALSGDGSGSIH